MKTRFYFILVISIFFSSCYTSGDFTTVQKFNIIKGTRIAIRCNNDDLNLGSIVETKLLIIGMEVVPYETAINSTRQSTDIDLESTSNKLKGNISSSISNADYIASSIVIDINYRYQYGLALSNITNMTAKIIDLETKKLLAVFSYRGGNFTTGVPDALAEDIANKLSKYIINN